jgi:hypothetical protein
MDDETRRVSEEVLARLRALGVTASETESPDELARLLDAVEEFERAVRRGGGDLMVDEPVGVGAGRPLQPDERAFVLPVRAAGESITDFIVRIATARKQASHAHRPAQ